MTRTPRIVAALSFLVALTVLAACGNDETPRAEPTSPSPSPSPRETVFNETEYTIATPAGWTREVVTASVDAKKAVKYQDGEGRYFIVALDPLGSDFAPDETWRYEVNGSVFQVVDKVKCDGEQCSTSDQRYDVYLLSKESEKKVGGHVWYFIFGNAKSTAFDAATFERILASIAVNS